MSDTSFNGDLKSEDDSENNQFEVRVSTTTSTTEIILINEDGNEEINKTKIEEEIETKEVVNDSSSTNVNLEDNNVIIVKSKKKVTFPEDERIIKGYSDPPKRWIPGKLF